MISKEYILDVTNWEIEHAASRNSYYVYLRTQKNNNAIGFITTEGKFENRSGVVMQIPKELHIVFNHKNEYYYLNKEEAELALKSFLEKIQPKVFKKEDLELLK